MINLLKKFPFKKHALLLAIPLDFFGLCVLGPIETNIGGSGKPLIWPSWNPTSFRAISNYGGVPPGYTYTQGISQWGAVETSNGTYDWSLFDLVWPKLISQGVTSVLMALESIPQWAQVGNAYSFAGATISSGSPAVVTATGNQYQNGWRVFFTGGTLPSGNQLVLGRVYYVVNASGSTFNVAATSAGPPINTTGSAGTSTVTAADTPPASLATLSTWVTSYLTRATLDGLPIKFIEGMNEPNDGPGFYVGTQADLVAMQKTIFNAARAYDPTIKVLSPPFNTLATFGLAGAIYAQAFLSAGGGAYADIIAFHGYPADPGTYSQTLYYNELSSFISMLASQGQSWKPIWNTEYSSASGAAAADETYLAATTFIDLCAGIARKYYYAYENGSPSDILWSPPNVTPPNGALNVAGIAYQQLVGWLTGATLTSPLSVSGVVWSVNLTLAGGMQARAVWTVDGSTPSYPVPSWATQYKTLAGGTVTGLGATVVIGGNPLLFSERLQ